MAGKYISLTAKDGGSFRAYLAPAATGRGPGIVLCQEIFGINAYVREVADQYAAEGYTVLAPDLFWRMEPGVQLGYSEPEIERALGLLGRLDEERALDDIAACAKWLRQQGYSQIAMVGFCLGGKLGPLSLARGAGDAAVAFYGVGLEQRLEALRKINQPIQMHFGDKDTHVPSPAVAAIEGVAKERSNIEVLRYPEGGHGFFRPDLKNEESQVAYRRMLVFLERELPG